MNFLDRYIHTAGVTFTPPAFHRWACLSLVAAALADRVWIEKLKKQVYPNIYVLLVGPSGCGKGEAIDTALMHAKGVPALLSRILRGGLTKQRLLDILGGRTTKREKGEAVVSEQEANKAPWIVYPELYNSLGAGGPIAESFIANLTDLYSGSPVPMTEGTRTWGDVVIEKYILNWLAGTTESWLKKSLSPEAILSGFFGRTVTIVGSYNDYWCEASYPPNYNDLLRICQGQLEQISQMAGPVALTPEAQHVRVQWMQSREVPTDPFLRPMYQRDDDLFLKLCMVLAACDLSYTVSREHAIRARDLVRERWAPGAALVRIAQAKPESDQLETVSGYIRQAGRIDHSTLIHKCSGRGIMAKTANSVIDTLLQGGRVTMEAIGRKRWYQWQAGRMLPAVAEPAEVEPQTADLAQAN